MCGCVGVSVIVCGCVDVIAWVRTSMYGWVSLDCRCDSVNACVQCMHLEYVANLHMYMCLHFL